MKIKRICNVYFSPTGNTKAVTTYVSEILAKCLSCSCTDFDFTLPASRREAMCFDQKDFVVLGLPVYAGKLPNKLLPFVKEKILGNDTLALPLVTYGNRSFDHALAELSQILSKNDFLLVSAAACVCQHAFTEELATGRPDQKDLGLLKTFAEETAKKIETQDMPQLISNIPGNPLAPYYQPLCADGSPAVFLKAKPVTSPDKCTGCGLCAENCPMGSISLKEPSLVTGICIKCHSCITRCPSQAKSFVDQAFLSHKAMLLENFKNRKESEFFL